MENYKIISNQIFPLERALYRESNLCLENCRFEGQEDGESALKEATNIVMKKCYMDLRYPLWHVNNVSLLEVTMTNNCRAPLWYTNMINIDSSLMMGIKALRECTNINISKSEIISPEFSWRGKDINIDSTKLESEYAFFESENLNINKLNFTGKYSFQYVKNMKIKNSILNTKDAFWHTSNVTVLDSTIEGEYLAWYSDNLTLVRCNIIGTQPLCYCTNLKLIDCTMENTDLAFEYSDVNATIIGSIDSVKNPKSGFIQADEIKEVIKIDSKYDSFATIKIRNNK